MHTYIYRHTSMLETNKSGDLYKINPGYKGMEMESNLEA